MPDKMPADAMSVDHSDVKSTHEPIAPKVPEKILASIRSQEAKAQADRLSIPSNLEPAPMDPAYAISKGFLRQLPDRIGSADHVTRSELADLGASLHPSSSATDLSAFLLLVNAWGFGAAGYGPWRTQEVIANADFDHSARQAIEILHGNSSDAAVCAYYHLNNRSAGRVAWWGPAFFTKFLAFADPAQHARSVDDRYPALILDRWMAVAVRDVTRQDGFPDCRWTTPQYAYYLALMQRLSGMPSFQEAPFNGDTRIVERTLFSHYRGH